MGASLRALRLPGLPRLAGALTLAELGETLASIALAVVVFGRSGSVLATGAFFVAARLGPAFASQPLSALIDRVAGRRGLAFCFVAEAILFALLALPLPVPVLILVPLATGTVAVCCRSVTRAEAAVRLTRAGRLRDGNSGLNIGFAIAGTAGAAAGGALAALTSPAVPLLAASACFLVGAALIAGPRATGGGHRHGLRASARGLRARPLRPHRDDADRGPDRGHARLHARDPDRGRLRRA
jgi:hypothetical protein